MNADQRLRVLFVDDEARLLDGLRRAMRPFGARWDMSFAVGGADALSHLSGTPADVVVTDMRMPGLDGPTLLREIVRTHPDTIRVILSGQVDATSARRAMNVAHQFLTKPIAAPTLAATIVHLGTARRLLREGELRQRVSAAGVLPASPAAYEAVTRLCGDSSASVAQFAEVIECDPAMTAKLLQLSASAFVGLHLRATRMVEVVGYLGLDTLRAVVRDGGLATAGCDDPILTATVETHQRHALLVARIARRIVPDRRLADDAFAAGLLHDIGTLFVRDQSDDAALRAHIGGYLLGLWGLPEHIVASVAAHDAPGTVAERSLLAVVTRTATALARESTHDDWTAPPCDVAVLEEMGMEYSQAVWRAIAVEETAALRSTPT